MIPEQAPRTGGATTPAIPSGERIAPTAAVVPNLASEPSATEHDHRPQPNRSRTTDPEALRRAYALCRRTAAAHGRTYYLATRLLAAPQRPAVHALYAFARLVDDIVDGPAPTSSEAGTGPARTARGGSSAAAGGEGPARTTAEASPAAALDAVEGALRTAWSLPAAPPTEAAAPGALPAGFDAVAAALTDTVVRYALDPRHFWTFLDSMRMDAPGSALFRNRYATMAELNDYMRGSAAAIGLQVLPVLGTVGPRAAAEPAAAALGNAFQLTNFLRDIGEDLDRDRIYLPGDEFAAFGVDADLLRHCRRTRRTDRRVRRALAHFIALNRDLYRHARPGIALLAPRVRPGIRTAATVYAAILDCIEDSGYDVFARRAVVPQRRRLILAAGAAIGR